MARELLEQRELGARQVHRLVAARHEPAGEIDLEVVDADHDRRGDRRCGTRRSAARMRASSSSVSNGLVT